MGIPIIAGRGWQQRDIPIILILLAGTTARAMDIPDLWEFIVGTDGGRVSVVVFMVLVAFTDKRKAVRLRRRTLQKPAFGAGSCEKLGTGSYGNKKFGSLVKD